MNNSVNFYFLGNDYFNKSTFDDVWKYFNTHHIKNIFHKNTTKGLWTLKMTNNKYNDCLQRLLCNFEMPKNSLLFKKAQEAQNELDPVFNSAELPIINSFNVSLILKFPGKKALTQSRNNGKIIHDYRVDLDTIPISHVNIVLDLYNKVVKRPDIVGDLYDFLTVLANDGYSPNLIKRYQFIDSLNIQAPSCQFITEILSNCQNKDKVHLRSNANKNYSIAELAISIFWIALQEDINYPREKGFEGRQMPFDRYIEALAVADNKISCDTCNIAIVLGRTIATTRPTPLVEVSQYYHYIKIDTK